VTMANNNDKKVLNVPALRFPEFSGEWKHVHLKEIAEFQKQRISTALLNNNNYISTENILQDFEGIQCSSSMPANVNVIKYQNEDILLSNIRPYLKKVWFADRKGGCSADVLVLRGNKCDKYFLYYVIASDRFINYVMSGIKGVKMPRGDKNQMEEYAFSIPTNMEQKRIAKFISILDERIRLQNKIIEKLQSLIKGITILLTTKGEPNTTIAQCLECHSSTLQEREVSHSGLYKVFGANGLLGYTDMPQMNGDSILIIKDGSGVGTVSYAQGDFSIIGTLNYLTALSNYDVRYLYFVLSVFNFQSYKTGMAIPHIYFKDYGNAKIYCPPLSEQKRIANVLGKLESKLFLEQNILVSFNLQKQYLLHQMFI